VVKAGIRFPLKSTAKGCPGSASGMTRRFKICGKEIRVRGRWLRIGQLEGDKYEFLADPAAIVDALRKSGDRIDLFTFLQRLPETAPKYAYPMEWDNLAVIPVSTFDHWWTQQIRGEARNRARQAGKKGVMIREVPFDDLLVKGIWQIYNETPVRQGRRFPHYGKDLKTVHDDEATFLESSIFIGAFLREKLIGFVKLTVDETGVQANLMNILSMIEHRDKAPTNALIAHSVRACAERGISNLVYQSFSYGNKQRDGIMKFKQVNGFQRVDLPRYYVPLTHLGGVAFRLGLHRRLVDHLPESVVGTVRRLRDAWYGRRSQAAKESA
jgi:hypothetical protein